MNRVKIIQSIIDKLKQADELNLTPCFVFDRISDKSEESKSLEFQNYHADRYVKEKCLHAVHVFNVTESGWSSENRKIFQEMLNYSENFLVKDLVFKNSDRLSRNLKDLLKIQELIEKSDYNIHFFESYQVINKDSSYDEKWILELLILVAKRHSDKISHDVQSSNRYKIQKGIAPFRSPIGYIYDKVNRVHIIDEALEKQMRWIFDEFDTGRHSLTDFVHLINIKGIKTQNGNTWSKSTLHHLLTNPFYHGCFYSRKEKQVYQGNHEPYYEESRYWKRRDRLSGKYYPRKEGKKAFHLSNLIRCKCGAYYYGDLKKGRYVYYEHPCHHIDNKHDRLNENTLFAILDEKIKKIQLMDNFAEKLKELFRDIVNERKSNKQADLKNITRKINQLELKKDDLLPLFCTIPRGKSHAV